MIVMTMTMTVIMSINCMTKVKEATFIVSKSTDKRPASTSQLRQKVKQEKLSGKVTQSMNCQHGNMHI